MQTPHSGHAVGKQQWTLLSWPVIIIAFIVFYPVGIVLLLMRIMRDRRTNLAAGRTIKIVGIVLLVLYALMFITGLTELGDGGGSMIIGATIIFLLPGYFLFSYGKRLQREASDFREYINLVVNHRMSSIDRIAELTKKDAPTVKNQLKKMIDRKFLADAYIDEQHNLIVLPGHGQPSTAEPAPEAVQQGAAAAEAPRTKTVACPGCGANNMIVVGQASDCEYCGCALNG